MKKSRKKFWNISPDVGRFLFEIILERNYKKVFEIGTSNGYSGIWLAQALTSTNGHLYTMESHRERFSLAQENFKKSKLKNITQILGHAPEAIPRSPHSFDLAFFDATKYEHIEYFKVLSGRIRKGGMIITDNILSHSRELTPYVSHIKKLKNWKSFTLNIGTGLLISLKVN